MRRLFGASVLVVGASLVLSSTAAAKEPEGRVVNTNPKRVVKKLVDTAGAEATPTEPTRSGETRWMRAGAPPEEPAPVRAVPTDEAVVASEPAEFDQPTTENLTDDPLAESTPKVVRTFENIQVTEEEKRRAAAGRQAAAAEEQQMHGRIRSLQMLIAKEEQLLAKRLEYAAQLREKGLAANDQAMLTKAEQFERASLVEYQKKVEQFERASVMSSAPEQSRRGAQPPRTSKNTTVPRSR